MRYKSPARELVDRAVFSHPIFAEYQMHLHLLSDAAWPEIAALNLELGECIHPHSKKAMQFVAQTPALLTDSLHYEQRIFERGQISTREKNWHDLLNAMIWMQLPALKAALNARQHADIAKIGTKQRTRGQCALTHFDEAGVVVWTSNPELIEHWDKHHWQAMFYDSRAAFADDFSLCVFGHALLEHALSPDMLMVGKALLVKVDAIPATQAEALTLRENVLAFTAKEIAAEKILIDPQELRPLPLNGLPGWHLQNIDAEFYTTAPCFRPRRLDRDYPRALSMSF